MQTLRLYLEEISGDWFGGIESFPGATSVGATPQAATQNAPCALMDYLDWLRGHGETLSAALASLSSCAVFVEVVETYSSRREAGGSGCGALFAPDERPLSEEESARYLQLLGYAHVDLHKAVSILPPDAWDCAPIGSKSVRSILQHLVDGEQALLRCLHTAPLSISSNSPLFQLDAVRQGLMDAICALPANRRGEIYTVGGERWTLRKMLRRALWHERYHAAQIALRSNPTAFFRAVVADTRQWSENVHAPV